MDDLSSWFNGRVVETAFRIALYNDVQGAVPYDMYSPMSAANTDSGTSPAPLPWSVLSKLSRMRLAQM